MAFPLCGLCCKARLAKLVQAFGAHAPGKRGLRVLATILARELRWFGTGPLDRSSIGTAACSAPFWHPAMFTTPLVICIVHRRAVGMTPYIIRVIAHVPERFLIVDRNFYPCLYS